MVDIRKAVPRKSEYLAAEDLEGRGDVKLTIKTAGMVPRPSHWGRSDASEILVISFEGAERSMWVGTVNSRAIASWYGFETDGWVGKSITIYATTTKMGRDTVPCIRVREKKARRVSNGDYE
jgi:hypothetical protein